MRVWNPGVSVFFRLIRNCPFIWFGVLIYSLHAKLSIWFLPIYKMRSFFIESDEKNLKAPISSLTEFHHVIFCKSTPKHYNDLWSKFQTLPQFRRVFSVSSCAPVCFGFDSVVFHPSPSPSFSLFSMDFFLHFSPVRLLINCFSIFPSHLNIC